MLGFLTRIFTPGNTIFLLENFVVMFITELDTLIVVIATWLMDRGWEGARRHCVARKDEKPQEWRPRHGVQGAPKAWRSWDHEVRGEMLSCTYSHPKQKVHFGLLKSLPGSIVSGCPGYWAAAGFGLSTSTQHLRTWPGSRTLFHFEISNRDIYSDSPNSFFFKKSFWVVKV